jgi:hypothetical protein
MIIVRLIARHGILLLAVLGAGARFAWSGPPGNASSAASSQSLMTSAALIAGANAAADPRDSHPGEPNDSIAASGAATALAESTPGGRSPASAASEVVRGVPCVLVNAGLRGVCMEKPACVELGGHLSMPGHCPGPSNVECCTREPHVEDHPPAGWSPLPQTRVTAEMAAWAAMIVGSAETYPMGSMLQQRFGRAVVLARVEWHPGDLGHGVIHRGVTLYQPA